MRQQYVNESLVDTQKKEISKFSSLTRMKMGIQIFILYVYNYFHNMHMLAWSIKAKKRILYHKKKINLYTKFLKEKVFFFLLLIIYILRSFFTPHQSVTDWNYHQNSISFAMAFSLHFLFVHMEIERERERSKEEKLIRIGKMISVSG